ncbi:iron-containing alcohol dehydrogenase [Halomonas sp.]|uniref:iron-containing alcohol dehydrogenase n=1 Tax=Halomonas sp. TaxID=1486246 RepID=UPI0025BFAD23|nr:iron-containing alcohol dehydrogenase [Halomonas sp.]
MWKTLPLRGYLMGLKAITAVMPFRWPEVYEGPGSALELVRRLAADGHRRVMVVSDATLVRLGLLTPLCAELERLGVEVALFDAITPDPTIDQIEAGLEALQRHAATALLAVGGGSPIDAAKLIGARARNRKPVARMAGLFRMHRGMLPLYAVPTTAGTGSEATLAAVVRDPERQCKLAAVDPRLIPTAAALDAELMVGLPPHITAATGMDALTHAVEAYISRNALARTDEKALEAARLVILHLPEAYRNGENREARQQMARAAHLAGIAFTQAGVGYVHAIAHQFGARYGTPHGLANAIAMPRVLDHALPACEARLAQLARHCGLGPERGSSRQRAEALVAHVRDMKEAFGIPDPLADLRETDIPAIARAARAEARFTYAVPRYLDQPGAEALVRGLLPPA